MIEGGHEDDERHARRADSLDDIESAGAGHLDVEKHQIGLEAPDGVDRVGTRGTLGDDLEPVLRGEKRAQPLTGQRLVVGDEDAHLSVRHATWNVASPGGTGAWWNGISSRTARPLFSSENSRRWAVP